MDGDDFYHQDKIRLSYEILENNQNLNIAYSNYSLIKNKIKSNNKKKLKEIILFDDLINQNSPPAPMSNLVYRAKWWLENKYYFDDKLKHLEDWDFLLNFRNIKIGLIDEYLLSIKIRDEKTYNDHLLELKNRLYLINKRLGVFNDYNFEKDTIISIFFLISIKKNKKNNLDFFYFLKTYIFFNLLIIFNKNYRRVINTIFKSILRLNFVIYRIIFSSFLNKIK